MLTKLPIVDTVLDVCDDATAFYLRQAQMGPHDLFYLSKLCFTTSETGAIPVDLGIFRYGLDIWLCTVNVTGPAWNSYSPGIYLPSEYRVVARYRTLDVGDTAQLHIFGYLEEFEGTP